MPELKPTSGAAWRKQAREGQLVEMPSGNMARLKSVSAEALILAGRIPDHLTGVVAQVMNGKEEKDMTFDELKGWAEFQDIVVSEAFVEPRIVINPQEDDEIGITDVDPADKNFVLAFLNRPLSDLKLFRPKQESHVEPVDTEQSNGRKTKQADAAGKVGAK